MEVFFSISPFSVHAFLDLFYISFKLIVSCHSRVALCIDTLALEVSARAHLYSQFRASACPGLKY